MALERNNVSIYIASEDRDFFRTFQVLCTEILGESVSAVMLRALRFWVAHLPLHLRDRWKQARERLFVREQEKLDYMKSVMRQTSSKSG